MTDITAQAFIRSVTISGNTTQVLKGTVPISGITTQVFAL